MHSRTRQATHRLCGINAPHINLTAVQKKLVTLTREFPTSALHELPGSMPLLQCKQSIHDVQQANFQHTSLTTSHFHMETTEVAVANDTLHMMQYRQCCGPQAWSDMTTLWSTLQWASHQSLALLNVGASHPEARARWPPSAGCLVQSMVLSVLHHWWVSCPQDQAHQVHLSCWIQEQVEQL